MAIVLPEDKIKSNTIFILASIIVMIYSVLVTFILALWGDIIFGFLNASILNKYFYFVGIGTYTMAMWQVFQYTIIREKQFALLARNKIIQVFLTQSIILGTVFFTISPFVLITAQISGFLIICLISFIKLKPQLADYSKKQIRALLKEYIKFPLLNTPMVFINTLSIQLPTFMFAKFFNAEVIGLYMIANRLVSTPFKMLSKSVGQVYYQAASEAFNKSIKNLHQIYIANVRRLSLIALIPLFILLIFSPLIVDILFQDEWQQAGTFMQILSIWLFFQFVISPVSMTFSIVNKQELALILTLASLFLRFTGMYLFNDSAVAMLIAFTVASSIFYIIYHFVTLKVIKSLLRQNGK